MISCKFENGTPTSLRHITVCAIVVKNDQVLLCKRGMYKGKPILEFGKWALPGGFLDRDENLVQGIKREVLEESGWEIDNITLMRIVDNPNRPREDRQNVNFVFTAQAVKQAGKYDEETEDLRWFSLNSLPSKEKMAFDHADDLQIYKKFLQEKFSLPILG